MQQVDISQRSKDAESVQLAEARLALLTPIVKAFFTETAQEATSHGIQVYGGHGYISEWGMEQLARDTRISSLYEGTTGIQSLDLLGRKVLGSKGELLAVYLKEISAFCETVDADEQTGLWCKQLGQAMQQWQTLTATVGKAAGTNPDELGAASVDYLMFSGYVTLAYYWLKMATVAKQKLAEGTSEIDFYRGKVATAQFYFARLLPRAQSHAAAIEAGAASLMDIGEDMFKAE